MSNARIEAAIQRALVAWIKSDVPQIHQIVATLNENNHHCMDMGCEAGITDLLLFKAVGNVENTLYLELKTKTGKLSSDQKKWADKRIGFINTEYAVAYGLAEAQRIVLEWATREEM